MYTESEIKEILQEYVQAGRVAVTNINADGEPTFTITEEGRESLDKLIAEEFNLSYEDYLQCPDTIKKWFTKVLMNTLRTGIDDDKE